MAEYVEMTVQEFFAAHPNIAAQVEPAAFYDPVYVFEDSYRVQGDFSLDRKGPMAKAGSFVFLGDLEISGSLANWQSDYGAALFVQGELNAQNIIAGGSFIYLQRAIVPGVTLGHYNHGRIQVLEYVGDFTIGDGHDMYLRPINVGLHISSDPQSGHEIHIDDWDIPFGVHNERLDTSLAAWFKDTDWVYPQGLSPEELDEAIEAGELEIYWWDWVKATIEAGAPAQNDTFTRFAAYMRGAFAEFSK